METILSIRNLDKKYGKVHAVNNLSFDIQKGTVYGILGPNGSGKSTTLGIILNVVNKTSGSFSWFNGNLSTHEALKKVGAIIERPNFYPYMSAVQNLQLICKIKGVSYDKIEEKLKIVNLFERRNSKFKTYSLGMKQRLAIASALLNDPEILILDEPTNGLDPQGIHEIRQIIKEIAKNGTTILLASHLLDEVEKVCSHVVVIRNGIKLYSGRVDEMTASNGFFELQADNQEILTQLLENHPAIGNIKEENGILIASLASELSASEINTFLFDKGISLSHLVKRKPSLEQQFLDLTNNQ
ncbi:ABC-2 type transport system ATP-binding protein [Tenacibaculum mesophilum]|uniref:ATP-binding cassette domain-containing protein n=1 Tax=Tenacibaculum mesophilum TaxID=104268 RepID=A0ABN5T4D6_9FLAO|nr:ATP-binding cassette domain-containing protein [Tenacibaculum mesophilum]AZJ31205.1 ATP-binding cassette domain-containing protein [Tenacibaculum mesophilum]KAF9660255.1 ATP-binding cassette domain-containing protein [Tenacibaculum mesophilum]QFS29252.1 ATP-binding cassette domain-containing protein [Tenacibaculum mesophilum]SHF50033.1 ABC-2 type transport system ATP-binding protein [Tenacibaculum mesophilum]BFF38149.1 ABC transporter ATP-binding protein [Tenacibaculum mesophilum]